MLPSLTDCGGSGHRAAGAAKSPPDGGLEGVRTDGRENSGDQLTAWTSRTSGMKWRSRFWMPLFSVAVEDGQPEQEPRMLR